MDEYIIINKTVVQKRIERLKQSREVEPDNHQQSYLNGKIKVAEEILSQSVPLVPIVEKAFDAGENNINTTGNRFNRNGKQYYISNLKLDI